MAEGGGFEPPEGVNLQQFSRPPQSAALPSLRRPISWRHENGGASGTRTHVAAVQRRCSPSELWPRENHGRSDWIRTSDPLLPKQVRYLCATLRYGRQHHADGPRQGKHSKKSNLPEKLRPPARCRRPGPFQVKTACLVQHRQFSGPQSRQRPVVISKMETASLSVAAGQGREKKSPAQGCPRAGPPDKKRYPTTFYSGDLYVVLDFL